MEGQIVRTIKDFLTTKDGELCVNQNEYLQVKPLKWMQIWFLDQPKYQRYINTPLISNFTLYADAYQIGNRKS